MQITKRESPYRIHHSGRTDSRDSEDCKINIFSLYPLSAWCSIDYLQFSEYLNLFNSLYNLLIGQEYAINSRDMEYF